MLVELGSNPVVDVYGQFEPGRKMFVDRGWLINETEIQIRFYKDPIHMFKVFTFTKYFLYFHNLYYNRLPGS